ncbi:MAG: hypothetical protein ABI878_16040 [Acidobacteriota bacterium]
MKLQLLFVSIALITLSAVAAFGQDGLRYDDRGDHGKSLPVQVFQAAGPNAASIQSTVDQYRAALGGVNNANAAGPIATGRREINWDGGSPTNNTTSLGPTPFDVFLTTRGGRFTTPGTGFVQAPASGMAEVFNNPSYATIFHAFSPLRLFSPIGSRITDSVFFVPGGSGLRAATKGFGAVFADVDQQDGNGFEFHREHDHENTVIEYYDARDRLLFRSLVPASPGDGGLSFFGIILNDARIARVRIATDAAPGRDDTADRDIVLLDDFIYGEPQALPLY